MPDSPEQNFSNHTKFTPIYHYALAPLTVALLVWSVVRFAKVQDADSGMMMLAALVLLLLTAIVRSFPLKVQDRVIRLEEQLRLYRVLPPEMHSRIPDFSVNQLVAMRFASDRELPDLARTVLADKVSDRKSIKQGIKQWRPDEFRV